jgi:hypothetical protein
VNRSIRVCASTLRWPWRSNAGTSSGRNGTSRLAQMPLVADQATVNASRTVGPYRGGRDRWNRLGSVDRTTEEANGVFAGVACRGDELTKDLRLLSAACFPVAGCDLDQHLAPSAGTHERPHHLLPPRIFRLASGDISGEASTSLLVSSYVRQCAAFHCM